MVCNTFEDTIKSSQFVHFNILSGELLVEGHPLGGLPLSILEHAAYKRLFGSVWLSPIDTFFH